MASIRRVTMKPPTILMVAISTEIDASAQTMALPGPIWSSAPMMMIPEILEILEILGNPGDPGNLENIIFQYS